MKGPVAILALGAIAAFATYWGVSRVQRSGVLQPATPHPRAHSPDQPASGDSNPAARELAWLATEFDLDPSTFARIQELHARYRPTCSDLCRRIEDHNRRLQLALLGSREITPEILRLIEEGALVRTDCHSALARHLLEVAACMPTNQAQRYLRLMLPATGITAGSHPIGDFTHDGPHE